MACVACGGAGGVCEASSEVYERVLVCTDRKGGWGSGTYQPTSAVTPQQPWHQLSLLAPKRGTLDRLYTIDCIWEVVLYRRAQCTGTGGKSTVYLYTEYRKVYIRYLGLKFGDMSRRLRSIRVSDLCG